MLSFLTIIGIVVCASILIGAGILFLLLKKFGLIISNNTWKFFRISGLVLFVLGLIAIFFGFFI